jgi:hypothetical protein
VSARSAARFAVVLLIPALLLLPALACAQVVVGGPPAHRGPAMAPMAPRTLRTGDSLRVPLVVDDVAPGTMLRYTLTGAPSGARVEGGVLRWRATRADDGAAYHIEVRALAGDTALASGTLDVTVVATHRPPVIRPPGDRVVPAGDSLTMPLDVTDPDGDAVSVAVTNVTELAMPPRYDASTNTLAWQAPRGMTTRLYLWRITATDGDGGTATAELHVAVRSQNVAPVCAPMRTYKRDEGERVTISLDADDANGDSLTYLPLATLPNGEMRGASYEWNIPYGFVLPTRQDSTVRFEWRATDPSQASTNGTCVALVTVFRSIAEGPFRSRQAEHRQLVSDVRSELDNYLTRERATRDSVRGATAKRRAVKRASLISALIGGVLQIAKSEDTRRIAAGVSATATVGLAGWETTLDDDAPLNARAEGLAQQRLTLQRALARFLRKYGETVSRETLLGPSYEADRLELYDLLAATGRSIAPPSM